jgi:hypothetical protein
MASAGGAAPKAASADSTSGDAEIAASNDQRMKVLRGINQVARHLAGWQCLMAGVGTAGDGIPARARKTAAGL